MEQIVSDAGAHFNTDRSRRYLLWRLIEGAKGDKFVLFIGLNPSIADEVRLDPTVTRCFNYAKRWGFRCLLMGNLYSKISTDPKGVDFDRIDVDDQTNNYWELSQAMSLANQIIVCWGSNASERIAGHFLRRTRQVSGRSLYCLGVNKNGSPKHPLYLKADVEPVLFEADLK